MPTQECMSVFVAVRTYAKLFGDNWIYYWIILLQVHSVSSRPAAVKYRLSAGSCWLFLKKLSLWINSTEWAVTVAVTTRRTVGSCVRSAHRKFVIRRLPSLPASVTSVWLQRLAHLADIFAKINVSLQGNVCFNYHCLWKVWVLHKKHRVLEGMRWKGCHMLFCGSEWFL
jgi:hypothetical protein